MQTSLTASLIAQFEGLRLKAYEDSGGVWTIGFGRTNGVKPGDTCTVAQASEWLAEDAAPLFEATKAYKTFSQAALVSFGYNCGLTAMKLVIEGKADINHFVHDRHGNVLEGLVRRRDLEHAILQADGFFIAG